jgi:hypothetical protein
MSTLHGVRFRDQFDEYALVDLQLSLKILHRLTWGGPQIFIVCRVLHPRRPIRRVWEEAAKFRVLNF